MLAGADPYIRTVQVGAQRVPYWQGGPAYAPWAQGYYSGWQGSNLIRDIAIGSMIFHGLSGLPYMMGGMGEGFGEIGEGVATMADFFHMNIEEADIPVRPGCWRPARSPGGSAGAASAPPPRWIPTWTGRR